MNKKNLFITLGVIGILVLLIISFVLGANFGEEEGLKSGFNEGKADAKHELSIMPLANIYTLAFNREKNIMKDQLLSVKAEMKYKNIGGFFNTQYQYYIRTTISNSARVATAKNIRLKISYLSSSGAVLSEETLSFNEFVEPWSSKKFSKNVNPPKQWAKYRTTIISADAQR